MARRMVVQNSDAGDARALAKLPAAERAAWRNLWQDVDGLLKAAGR